MINHHHEMATYRIFPLGTNFPKWSALTYLEQNFSKFPNNQRTHMSNISHKVYTCTSKSGLW